MDDNSCTKRAVGIPWSYCWKTPQADDAASRRSYCFCHVRLLPAAAAIAAGDASRAVYCCSICISCSPSCCSRQETHMTKAVQSPACNMVTWSDMCNRGKHAAQADKTQPGHTSNEDYEACKPTIPGELLCLCAEYQE